MVVPRRHYENLLEIEPEDLANTFAAAKRLVARMTDKLGADGVMLWNSSGEAAGQVVMHFHVHVIPVKGETMPTPNRPDRKIEESDIATAAAALRGEG